MTACRQPLLFGVEGMTRKSLLKAMCVVALVCSAAAFFVVMSRSDRPPRIRIEGQEGRLSPILLDVCSMFMRIENAGSGGDNLIKAEVNVPGVITEIHDIEEGKMIRRENVRIPANSTVVLRPMGYHLMAYKMPQDAKVGYEFTLRLVFEKSGERDVPIRIEK